MIIASPMLSEDGIVPSSGGAGAGSSRDEEGEYGVDPNLDPELAMVRNDVPKFIPVHC